MSWTLLPFGVMASLTIILVVVWDLLAVPALSRWSGRWSPSISTSGGCTGSLSRRRELDRLKDEFMAVVSHELRLPLTVRVRRRR